MARPRRTTSSQIPTTDLPRREQPTDLPRLDPGSTPRAAGLATLPRRPPRTHVSGDLGRFARAAHHTGPGAAMGQPSRVRSYRGPRSRKHFCSSGWQSETFPLTLLGSHPERLAASGRMAGVSAHRGPLVPQLREAVLATVTLSATQSGEDKKRTSSKTPSPSRNAGRTPDPNAV